MENDGRQFIYFQQLTKVNLKICRFSDYEPFDKGKYQIVIRRERETYSKTWK